MPSLPLPASAPGGTQPQLSERERTLLFLYLIMSELPREALTSLSLDGGSRF